MFTTHRLNYTPLKIIVQNLAQLRRQQYTPSFKKARLPRFARYDRMSDCHCEEQSDVAILPLNYNFVFDFFTHCTSSFFSFTE